MNIVVSKEKRLFLLSQEKEWKALLKLSAPSIAGMIIVAIYNVVDAWFIGQLADTQAQAAVSVIFPLLSLFMAAGQMIGISGGAYLSRCLGAKDIVKAESTLANAIWAVLIFSFLITILILIFFEPVLCLLGATSSNLTNAKEYGHPLICMCFLTMFTMTANNFIRAEGNTSASMIGIIIGGVVNALLDPLFMFWDISLFHYLGWYRSVSGAAWATVISQLISALFLARYMLSNSALVRIDLRKWKLEKEMFYEISGIAFATFSRQALIALSIICFNFSAKHFSSSPDAMLAAIGVVIRITSLPFFAIIGFLQAYQPFVAFNYGAKQFSRVKNATQFSLRFCSFNSGIICLILFLFAGPISSSFLLDKSVEGIYALQITISFLRVFILPMPFLVSYLIFSTLFQAIGRVPEAIILSVARNGLFFIPLIFLLPWTLNFWGGAEFSDLGIILTQPCSDLFSIFLAMILAKRGRSVWKT